MAFAIPPVPRPEHVSPEQVIDFDIYALQAENGEYQTLISRLLHARDAPNLLWTPQNGGHWIASRAAVMEEVLESPERFSSRQISVIGPMNPSPPFAPLQIDPPDHNQYRKLLGLAMSPKSIEVLGANARVLAIELIEGFKKRGECEFIGDFAAHLPIAIFMSMVNLPAEDRPELLRISELLVRNESLVATLQANQQLSAYTMQKIAERRANPGDDLISHLIRAQVGGAPMTDHTLIGMINLLLLAGLDTVASMMGFFACHLAQDVELRQQLIVDPRLIRGAVEEMLRRFPITNLARLVVADCTLAGSVLKAGEMILLPTAAAGLDEQRYDNPQDVDLQRKPCINATFGGGAHRCLGAMLARVELNIFIEEWLPRIPDFQIRPGTELHVHSGSVAAICQLPLVWGVT